MSDPYRTAAECLVDPIARPNVFVRAWRKVFGHLVYGGERTCGHCRYWTAPSKVLKEVKCDKHWHGFTSCSSSFHLKLVPATEEDKGDCKLLFGEEDTLPTDTCARFTARRRYKHRVRT